MASKIIALEVQLSIYKDGETAKKYAKGDIIGTLTENLNNGTLLVNDNEIVDENKVAIILGASDAVFNTSKDVLPSVTAEQKNAKIKKIVSLAIIGGGAFLIYKNKKAIGLAVIVAGLLMVKSNFSKK